MSPAASRIATFGLSSSCCCTRSTVLHPPILHNQAAIPIAFSPQVLYLRRQNGKKMLILPNYRNHHHPLRPCSVNDNQDSQIRLEKKIISKSLSQRMNSLSWPEKGSSSSPKHLYSSHQSSLDYDFLGQLQLDSSA